MKILSKFLLNEWVNESMKWEMTNEDFIKIFIEWMFKLRMMRVHNELMIYWRKKTISGWRNESTN